MKVTPELITNMMSVLRILFPDKDDGELIKLLSDTYFTDLQKRAEDRLSILKHSPWSFAHQ